MTKKEQQKQAYEYFKSLGKSYLGIIGKDPKDNRIVQSMKDHKKFGFEQSETWGFGSQLVEYIIPRYAGDWRRTIYPAWVRNDGCGQIHRRDLLDQSAGHGWV